MGAEENLTAENAVTFERKGAVAIVTLNRPEAINALNDAVRTGLASSFREAEADPEVRVVLLRAAGQRGFCVGADIKEFRAPPSLIAARRIDKARAYIDAIASTTKPTIAAVQGFCLGGGFEIALSCDLRIAARDAVFGLPEVNLGLIPGSGGTQRLPRLIGTGRALDLMLTGRRIAADEAFQLGVVTRLAESQETLFDEALAIAEGIAGKSPSAVAYIKEAVLSGADLALKDGIVLERNLFTLLMSTEDRLEAAAAFREKRPAVFTGR
jgi:enoyl-CoA hydratase/carnithine racemase